MKLKNILAAFFIGVLMVGGGVTFSYFEGIGIVGIATSLTGSLSILASTYELKEYIFNRRVAPLNANQPAQGDGVVAELGNVVAAEVLGNGVAAEVLGNGVAAEVLGNGVAAEVPENGVAAVGLENGVDLVFSSDFMAVDSIQELLRNQAIPSRTPSPSESQLVAAKSGELLSETNL